MCCGRCVPLLSFPPSFLPVSQSPPAGDGDAVALSRRVPRVRPGEFVQCLRFLACRSWQRVPYEAHRASTQAGAAGLPVLAREYEAKGPGKGGSQCILAYIRVAPCLAIYTIYTLLYEGGGTQSGRIFEKGTQSGRIFEKGTQPGNILAEGYPSWARFSGGVPNLGTFSKRVPEWEAPKVGKKPKLGAPRKRVPNPGAFLQKGTQAGCVFAKGTRAEIEFHERVPKLGKTHLYIIYGVIHQII